MAGCCGSDERSRARKLLWPAVWLLIGAFVVGLWAWERQPHRHHAEVGPRGGPLVVWDDGAIHLEIDVGRDEETAVIYTLDRWAKRPKPIDAKPLTMTLKTDPETVVTLDPAPDAGDPAGQSTRFIAREHVFWKGARMSGTVSGTAGGKAYSGNFSEK
ncbi:MAG: hypothetical protein K2X82_18080 [Gemmataceae bacterium]|nr:hypothetical protein [Gemmataceae bacterium]